jgi:hypothetical protein
MPGQFGIALSLIALLKYKPVDSAGKYLIKKLIQLPHRKVS